MDVKKHFAFNTDSSQELIAYLKRNGIPFSKGVIASSVDILESDPHWPILSEYIRKEELLCFSETIFSREELLEAEWLTVYSQYRFGYPQPEGNFQYEHITYSSENLCRHCGAGLVQADSFRIKKAPEWGKRNFMSLNWVGDELFLSEKAKTVLQDANITGIDFCGVKNKTGTEYFDGTYQLLIPTLLKKGLVEEQTGLREITDCPHCGTRKYVTNGVGMLAFKKETFIDAPDVAKSFECFGSGYYISRQIIVRQKVYRTIIENDLGRALRFQPIQLL